MDSVALIYASIAFAIFYLLVSAVRQPQLRHIPTVGGPSLPILSYFGALNYLFHAADILQEGYTRYKDGIFKHAEFRGWHVIVTGSRLTDELRKASHDELSFEEAIVDTLAVDYTLGPNIQRNTYHVPIIRSQLTRNLASLFPDLRDEIVAAFEDEIPLKDEGWTNIPANAAITQIVCRTSNRLFVGLPKCRDPDYCELNKRFTIDFIQGAAIINLFPRLLKPIVARFLTNVPRSVDRGLKHLGPIISERFENIEKLGEKWAEKPNDLLQWLIDASRGEEHSVRALVLRMLTVNVAAIHTSSMTFTHALFYLAAYPEYVQPLREEVEAVVTQEGWSKAAMIRMRKVDSFLKEINRVTGVGAKSLNRKAMKDITFSDGTFIPAGTFVSAASRATHFDEGIYPDALKFNPWRFSDMRECQGESTKHHMVSTSVDYLSFGHGRHACPGRFFAVNELKALLAHVVVTYDVRLGKEGELPSSTWFGPTLVPNTKAEVMFRKRQS
ncbi:cytochrome P450 [Laetiporus sulphureus 93-53]|uniref:Cytochrome P450 n=1 Tax=Laetiporus sulphureus 93-53 TaxID=1314785 RepID=A0A165F2V5_9APHY|nr:cytochrome P450 [Laetiporus sulphureus 93-53]KZT08258.1 cytochrome P450 [Laetiporus sulphureus 93-53]